MAETHVQETLEGAVGGVPAEEPTAASSSRNSHFKMRWQDKLQKARTFKEEGTIKYKEKSYKAALGKYHRALLYIKGLEENDQSLPFSAMISEVGDSKTPIPEDVQNDVRSLKLSVYNNLAACILQTEVPNYERVVQYCDNVLEMSSGNVKAMYRKGVALYQLKQPEDALEVLYKARQQPDGANDSSIKKYISLCEQAQKEQEQKMKKTYKGMFDKLGQDDDKDNPTS